jgi:predicted DsbA family dithiol-disulfide isomerase
MKIEIWSDVICPFCYIGKRKLEDALARFPGRDQVEVEWKSFQLAPDAVTDPTRSAVQNLAEKKGWTLEFTRQAMASVVERAQSAGLAFDYERATVANTFDAHRLAHFAASQGCGDEMHERLFSAYFSEGRNVGDPESLAALAADIGLPATEVREVLASNRFEDEVRRDIDFAQRIGINGVPLFVFDRKYAVSGAQDTEIFLEALRRALPTAADAPEASCGIDGNCA